MTMQLLAEVPRPIVAGIISIAIRNGPSQRTSGIGELTVEWFSLKKGPWRRERVPTRGEYLIRAGGVERMRPYRAVLVLQAPYLAVVRSREV
jgi:hypothetical protein